MGDGGLDLAPEPRPYPEDRFDAVVYVGAGPRPGEFQVTGQGHQVALPFGVDLLDGLDAAVVEHYLGVRAQTFSHSRPSSKYYKITLMEAGGKAVEVFEAGLDAGYLALLLVEALDHLQGPRRELGDGREVVPERPVGDAVDQLLGRIERLAHVLGFPEGVLGDAAAHVYD